MAEDEVILVEITMGRLTTKGRTRRIMFEYNSFMQDREQLERILIEQFKKKLKIVLDEEIEFSGLNKKKGE